MKRNQIDFWRLLFMIAVCVLHSGALLTEGYSTVYFSGGYIAVEFFFIVTGFYLAASVQRTNLGCQSIAERKLGSETLAFTVNRAKRMYPEFICGFIITLVLNYVIWRPSIISQIGDLLKSGIYELFLLHVINPNADETIFSVAWYISAVLVATFIIYPCLRVFPDFFKNYISPILMGMYICFAGAGEDIVVGNLTTYGVVMGGTLRAVAEIAWGTFLFERVQDIRMRCAVKEIRKVERAFWTAVEICSFLFVLAVSFAYGNSKWDFTHFILLSVAAVICLSEIDFRIPFVSDKMLRFCADFTFALYMTHRRIINFTKMLVPQYSYPIRLLIYLVIALAASYLVYRVCKLYRNKGKFKCKI